MRLRRSAGPGGRRNGLPLFVCTAAFSPALSFVITSIRRNAAHRIVRTLVERREAVESDHVTFQWRRADVPDFRQGDLPGARSREHPPPAKGNRSVVMRRLLSLDFVLEHPGMNWLPTEGEKVEFIEGLGVHSNLIPRRIYYGAVRAQKRYFALKLPVAGGDKTVTFAYVDPGHATAVELNSWGAAHGPLWDAIRAKGRRVEVIAIGAELDAVLRSDRLLQLWAAAEPGKVIEGLRGTDGVDGETGWVTV